MDQQPESKFRLSWFNCVELPRDNRNVIDGPGFRPFLGRRNFRSKGKNFISTVPGVWSGRGHHVGSGPEYRVFIVLEGMPWHASIREQYPFAKPRAIQQIKAGMKVKRVNVMTIDFVLTLRPERPLGNFVYQGLSQKLKVQRDKPRHQLRAEREVEALDEVGWAWDYAPAVTNVEVWNHELLRQYAFAAPLDSAAPFAAELARMFYRTSSDKPLRSLLKMFMKRLGVQDDGFFLFAAAYYFGFIGLNHNERLDEDAPVALVEPFRSYELR